MIEVTVLAVAFLVLAWKVKHPLAILTLPFVGGCIGFFIAWLVGLSFDPGPQVLTKVTPVREIQLASLKRQDVVAGRGSFFLGIGSINVDQTPYYYFYKAVDGGLFQLDRIPGDNNAYISEEDRRDGKIVQSLVQDQKEVRCGKIGYFSTYYVPMASVKNDGECTFLSLAEEPYNPRTRYEVHVPTGSIVRDYTLQ